MIDGTNIIIMKAISIKDACFDLVLMLCIVYLVLVLPAILCVFLLHLPPTCSKRKCDCQWEAARGNVHYL
jgi:hypothetical protein